MPWDVEFGLAGANIWFGGIPTNTEIHNASEAFWTHRFDEQLRYAIVDLAACPALGISAGEITRLARRQRQHAEHHQHVLVAIIAPEPAVYGVARMWQALIDDTTIRPLVCRTRAEAIAWLRHEGAPV
jgi:hypothetical protein